MKDLTQEEIKERVKKRYYTDREWNRFKLWRFVDYRKWIPLKQCTYEEK